MVKLRDVPDDSFVNFISQCLEWDPSKRLTPEQGLRHEWILKGLPQNVLIQHQRVQSIPSNELPLSARSRVNELNSTQGSFHISNVKRQGGGSKGLQQQSSNLYSPKRQQALNTQSQEDNQYSVTVKTGGNINHKQLLRRLIAK